MGTQLWDCLKLVGCVVGFAAWRWWHTTRAKDVDAQPLSGLQPFHWIRGYADQL